MKMASMRNHVRAGVLLTLAMVVTLVLVLTHATPALSQGTSTVGVSNLDEPAAGNTSKVGYTSTFYDEALSLSFCNGNSNTDSYGFSVNENVAENTLVGTVAACEPHGDSLTYSVGGTDAAAFNDVFDLDASTGEITVKSGASIDYEEGKKSYSLTVTVTDADDASEATIPMSIAVINLDEPGTIQLSTTEPGVGSALHPTLDDPDGWVVLFRVQWSRADTADGPFTELYSRYISSLRRASYTPEAVDEGQFLKVTLFYIDRLCRTVNNYNNQCRKMAEKTSDNAVAAAQSGGTSNQRAANTLATGGPGITGTVWVGEMLTATTDQIEDEDGLKRAVFTYQWLANDVEISDATDSSYTVTATDQGNPIHVRVTFTDDAGNEETLTSNAVVAATFNSIATGAPTISGTAQVGQMLTVSTSDISDSDGLDNANFTYQWISNDGTEDSHIQDATGSTYTVGADDEGKTIKVRVSFADDRNNHETVTSTATAAVTASPNSAATGAPTISGTAQVGQMLTVSTSDISDSDGLDNANFTYQWLSNDGTSDSNISGASSSTYTLVESDEGKTIKVRVTFTDDRGHQETLTSTATAAVTAAPSLLTVSVESAPTSHNGSEAFRIRVAFSETPRSGFSYTTMRDHAFTVTGGDVTGARRLVSGKNLRWEVTVQPSGNADVTVELPVTTDCAAQGAICTDNDEKLSNSLNLTVSGPEATPPPAVVVSALTVSVESAPTSHNGSNSFRIRIALSEAPRPGFSYTTMRDDAFTVTGGDVTGARRLVSGKNLRWEITVQPSGNADVTVELPVTTDCTAQGAICTGNDEKLSNSLNLTVSGPN